ncbi:hypothetical protein LTS08_003510 [Lithohypha guttulata]|nr:hypothetical protein LTS08_003510 [Lithohypha guttulata]
MAKIVIEVGLIAKTPSLSTDTTRDAYFPSSLVFKQLLPVVRTLSPEFASRGWKDPSAALLIGFVQPKTTRRKLPNIHKLAVPLSSYDDKLQALFTKNAHKAEEYRMQGCAGITKNIHSQAKVFSSVTNLDATYRPTRISAWHDRVIKGIRFEYANGIHQDQGAGEASHVLSLARDGSEIITGVSVTEVKPADKPVSIVDISIATSHCNILDVSTIHPEGQQSSSSTITDPTTTHTWTRPDESQ